MKGHGTVEQAKARRQRARERRSRSYLLFSALDAYLSRMYLSHERLLKGVFTDGT